MVIFTYINLGKSNNKERHTMRKRYKRYKGESLPSSAIKFLEKHADKISFFSGWCEAWYYGDLDTTEDWIIVTPDGGYYKVDGEYMTWYVQDGECRGRVNWSIGGVYKTRLALSRCENPPRDPLYQT